MSEPKIFSPSAATTPPIPGNSPGSEAPKSVAEVTSATVGQYVPVAGEAPAPVRKPRSDRGKPRVPKVVAGDAAPGQAGDGAPGSATAGFTLDKKIVEKTALAVLRTVDGAMQRKIGNTVLKLGGDVSVAKEMATDAGLSTGEAELMGELTGIVFEKNGLLTGYAPELLLGIMLSEWSIRVVLVMRRLNVIAEQTAKRRERHADTSSPDKDRN